MHAIGLPLNPPLSQTPFPPPESTLLAGSSDGTIGVGCGVNQWSLPSSQQQIWQ